MRSVIWFVLVMVLAIPAWAAQPFGIKLDPNGVSLIYPVFSTAEWVLTQPNVSGLYNPQDRNRLTHWGDDFYAQDWARGCGQTQGHQLFAGISGEIVWAGSRGPYGHTVVIYDAETRFALKYSHLSEVSVQVGEYVLAGKSFLGRVGNTGNIQSSGCSSNPGAHLHLSLHKNVSDPKSRPISSSVVTSNSGPTNFAAAFGYTTSVDLAKTATSQTVYALFYGTRVPVSLAAFVSFGWGFDKSQAVFNPMKNRIVSQDFLSGIPETNYFWPMRDNLLLKINNAATVYQFEDGYKRALSQEIFNCRYLRFPEIVTVPTGDRDRFLPVKDQTATGCFQHAKQALMDFPKFRKTVPGLVIPDWSSYGYYPDWDPAWELRWMAYNHPSGQVVTLYHITWIGLPTERFIAYWDPQTGHWIDWQKVFN